MPSIYAISDLHGNLPDFPEDADLLLIAGDICPDFIGGFYSGRATPRLDNGEQRQAAWLNTSFREWLERAPAPVVATWGNHDYVGEKRHIVPDLPWVLLIDHEVEIEGVRVWGTPWVPNLPRWAFYGRPEALQARADLIPEGLDVLMTHGPPKNVGDSVGYANVGDPTLNRAIIDKKPRVTICGHIHEDRGIHAVNVYNVAAVDGNYKPYPNPWVKLHDLA